MSSSTSLSLSFDPFPLPQQQPLPTTTTTTSTMSGDSDTGTSTPPRQPPTGFLPFANGSLKRQCPTSSSAPPPDHQSSSIVTYKECMRNHAASIGGHALDGCCEFMPSPTSHPSVPTSLRCAACGCHRNFHRRDPDDPLPIQHHPISSSAPPLPLIPRLPPPQRKDGDHNSSSAPHMLLALSREHAGAGTGTGTMMKKRSRTKFTREQKERMREFSEKIGWRMLRTHDDVIREFCDQIGVGRGVLKVWMHNHKHNAAFGNKNESNETSMDKSDIGSKEDDDRSVRDCKVEGNNADRRGEFYANGH
ncbi:hypothetical protein Droror1_Dr00008253 [Drosera rotundifolia]